jgi:hypothetical protein
MAEGFDQEKLREQSKNRIRGGFEKKDLEKEGLG